jgi:hypothetical protein
MIFAAVYAPKREIHIITTAMKKFQTLETAALVEMLAQHTHELTRMLTKAMNSKRYEKHKKCIAELQTEIFLRQMSHINTSRTHSDGIQE